MKMNRGIFSLLFIVISSVGNILFTIACMVLMFLLSNLVLRGIVHLPLGHKIYSYAFVGSFVVGLVGGFMGWTKISAMIIRKYDFDVKFDNQWNGSKQKKKAKAAEEERRQTVLPSSVLDSDEERAERDKWGES